MIPRRIALTAVLTAAIAAAFWVPRARPALAASAESAAPGQLTLLNRKGEAAGLCPLRHTAVTADIAGYVARVTVKQEFTNPSKEPVEAIYSFPLPNDAAVDDMSMTIGSRLVRGRIKRKEEALAIYTAAKESGQAAALLDQERPNIFTQQVANIMPGASVVITITYVNLLKYQDGEYEFVFPMVVGPRYIPGGGYTAYGQRGTPGVAKLDIDPGTAPVVLDGHRITPPLTPPGTRAGHDISLAVRLDAGIPLQSVAAVGHAVTTVPKGQSAALITLENRQEIPNRDFILHYSAAGSQMAEGLLAYSPSRSGASLASASVTSLSGYFTMIVQPPAAPPKEQISPKEMVFVIDQTGSQSGWPIAKAKETMKYCIANMNPGDTFQLIGFNTALYPCFPAPVPNTPDNVATALKFLAPIEGNGGTDILKSVEYALNIPDDPDRLRIVCYMTDGYVGNDMQIVDYIRKHRGRARMFPFGIGNSVNRFLIDAMAREGRGAAEYVAVASNAGAQYGGDMPAGGVKGAKDVAERFYRRIASPLLLDVHVDWNGLPVEDVYPKEIPDVFSAGPIILKGRYTHAAEGNVTVSGLLRGKPWSRTIHVSLPAAHSDGAAIPTLWAREKIEDLQSEDWLGAQTNSPHPEIQAQIINTALEYHLMSQYTSFVAVEERVVNIGGRQRTVDVPVELPDGLSYDHFLAGDKLVKEQEVAQHSFALGRSPAAGSRVRKGGGNANLLIEFGVTGQVLSNPDSNEIMLMDGEARAGAGGRKPALKSAKGGEAAPLAVPSALSPSVIGGATIAKPKSAVARNGYLTVGKGKAASSEAGRTYRLASTDQLEDLITPRDAERRLAAMRPEDRRAVLERAKLEPGLSEKLRQFRTTKGSSRQPVEVQIWISSLPIGGAAKLKALGFTLVATLTPGRLILGTVTLDKLDAILNLSFVRRVESPKYR